MATLETAEAPKEERSFKYWEGRVYKLEERVYVLENMYRKRNEEREKQQNKIMEKLGSLDFRQDMLAENLVDVREMVKEIRARVKAHDERFNAIDKRFDGVDKRFDGVDKRFDGVDKRFEGIEKTQAAHGEMLRQILERLSNLN